ncbi:MAG: ectoine/hydroxyectoine ABC transporter substrate-binding protein EhuB [Castellaniella sp.]|uniref:ectoine/hydroxyectoine ABC transporter substrate-binding protein EhuB n=1 Tax=Castellaniella sp. TaxID=1955812 RepID=UPI002A35DE3F|nr:ectoine/hydroxyectoine ABC transporter substrate-binding protein EhuB [Castellaniella sp.]MDY0309679.1 ectoine/hydroxyectoine ABC transporter substrate-binding protein EhuB [Castellaniella sp.]
MKLKHPQSPRIPHLLTAVTACVFGLGSAAQAADLDTIRDRGTLRVAVANEIPYGYMDLNGEAKGVGPDVAKQIAKALGIGKIEWTTTAFGSLIPGLQADRYDMVAAEMAILPQRCEQVLYSEPNSSYGEGLLVAKGNPKQLHSYEGFATSDHKIAIMAGADQLEILQALKVPADRIVTIANNADAISTVTTGRADAYAATSLTVGELAAKSKGKAEAASDFKDPVVDGQPVRSWGGFAFSKDSGSLRDAVNQELAKFKQTDEWQKIMSRYGFSAEDASQSFERSTAQLCTG